MNSKKEQNKEKMEETATTIPRDNSSIQIRQNTDYDNENHDSVARGTHEKKKKNHYHDSMSSQAIAQMPQKYYIYNICVMFSREMSALEFDVVLLTVTNFIVDNHIIDTYDMY